jgi:Cellulase (glycosyl hydrolase family 5)
MPLRMLARLTSAAIVLGGLLIRPMPVAAQVGPLAGELLFARAAEGVPNQITAIDICPSDATQSARVDFTVSGTATGPYPGTFAETGAAQFAPLTTGLRPVLWFSANFTINSARGQVSGNASLAAVPISDGWWVNRGMCSSSGALTTVLFEADVQYQAQIQTATGTSSDQGRAPLGLKFQNQSPTANLFGEIFKSSQLQPPAATSGYHVSGNRILDSEQHQFVVKGDDALYGRFAGGDANGYGLSNFLNRARDLDNLQSMKINLIRLSVSWDAAHLPPTDRNYIPFTEYMAELDASVALVTARGMVAVVSDMVTMSSTDKRNFAGYLASRYKTNPLVWIKPDNEPNCETGDGDLALCTDWSNWQREETSYVQAIRAAGNTQPILINCVGWSWDCSQIASYPLGDTNLIYGAHRYGNGAVAFDASQQAASDVSWANLASTYPMIVDEVGLENGPVSPVAWGAGFLDYTTNWVITRQGSGVIGFADAWSDRNSMTNSADGSWSDWGVAFITHYLLKVSHTGADTETD